MTGEVVNLRRARKARDRMTRADEAAANRLAHGRTRSEREATAVRNAFAERRLDSHRLSGSEPDGGEG